jgi:proteasome lid subunit RPN8/RPN11
MMFLTPVESQLRCAIQAAQGREICAFLLRGEEGTEQLFCLTNLSPYADCFVISQAAVDRAKAFARRHRMEVCAFIHSHMQGTELGAADSMSLAHSEWPWIIVSLRNGTLESATYPSR